MPRMPSIVASVAVFLTATPAVAAPDEDFLAAVRRMEQATAQLVDATWTMHATEYAGGRLVSDSYRVKHRAPNTNYLVWDKGQKVLWKPGWNGDKLRVDPGRLLLPIMNLDPLGTLAMRGNRHSIHRLGFVPLVSLFVADADRMLADLDRLRPEVEDLGHRDVFGQPTQCYRAHLRKDVEPRLYATKVEICLHRQLHLPIDTKVWDHEDGELRVVEHYRYEDLEVNVGLTDADFQPETYGL